ncbi:pilus (MSHA type) biogenesis protein MshL [Sulfuriferula thiophila]|uniref:pilus (MSHA type) biogenesis protein MshL n=1 Tax=Sulfuriferula thiophila TaxID=1781211 RepID=UPI000F607CF6|nr:pilus (MSHA type) biogenesis protein MshL [Sulfuriferula thiophila]
MNTRRSLTPTRYLSGLLAVLVLNLTGCAALQPKADNTQAHINTELDQAAASSKTPLKMQPAAVNAALLPPLQIALPKAAKPIEQRFDLVINNAPASQVFMGIVSGTPYSMLIPPDLTGNLSVNLKNVTVFEALDAIRELYGYDYKVDGSRIFIQPMTMQTRVFKLNYIAGHRKGSSDIRVTSGSVSDGPITPGAVPGAIPTTTPGAANSRAIETSKITTSIETDFWGDLKTSLSTIIGDKDGRNVVVNPQSGVLLIHAMPVEIHQVENYLKAMQLAVDRQVMLEAKIIEVQLNDGFQTGINWAAFNRNGQSRFSVGADPASFGVPGGTPVANSTLASIFSAGMSTAINTSAGLLNVAAQSDNFAALLNFLDTQGTARVLSSPRIATLNNQMAILKVGTDEFFVTNVTSTVTSTGSATNTATPNVTLRPFFSGIALDVTPQISDEGLITLHIHPSVSNVTEKNKVINLGQSLGTLTLPLASSTISETDSVVRVQDGSIVAIGGLMREASTDDKTEVPGLGSVPLLGSLFKHTNRISQKRELVILLKTTVVKGGSDWTQDVLQSRERIQNMQRGGS